MGKKDANTVCTLGMGLAQARKAAGYTQPEVARLLGRGQSIISAWECDRCEPSISNLIQLLKLYGARFEDMVRDIAYPVNITEGDLIEDSHPFVVSAAEIELVKRFRNLSEQNKEAIELVIGVYQKYQNVEGESNASDGFRSGADIQFCYA